MNSRDFIKPKKFNIKAKSIAFESTKFMTDLEKKKVYINFVAFLNNHFKFTLFKKNLYSHFHLHCGFIAHYNLQGFYGEYFETASSFHFNVNDYKTPAHECMGNVNKTSSLSQGEQFYSIYEELNTSRDGIGEFVSTLMNNQNWGGYSDYKDLDDAIKEALIEYKSKWIEEIKKAIKAFHVFSKKEKVQELKRKEKEAEQNIMKLEDLKTDIQNNLIKEKESSEKVIKSPSKIGQLNLFDFVAA